MAFAGLWESWTSHDGERIDSCTIIVTEANESLRPVHDRMPVILAPEHYAVWLDPAVQNPNQLQTLLRPCPSALITAYPVSRVVGNPANDGPICVAP